MAKFNSLCVCVWRCKTEGKEQTWRVRGRVWGWREKVAEEGVDNVQGSGICKVKRLSFA